MSKTGIPKTVFHQLPLGKTEKAVDIDVTVSKCLGPAKAFLKKNTIPGKPLFYKLVRIVLSRYFSVDYSKSVKKLFKKAWAYEATAELCESVSHKHFDELPHLGLRDIYPTKILKRRRTIRKYAKMGPPFPNPIYIQERVLNKVTGKKYNKEDIILVDGARRIIAGCLCGLRTMDVVLITKKKLKG